jgi:molybdopterin synthase sulfur carrier subunit
VTVPQHPGPPTVTVTVRYFAGAAAAAEVPEETVTLPSPAIVSGLGAELVRRHGAGLARVLAAASFIVDETAAGPDRPLHDGSRIDVLPPFAGG